MIGIVVVFPKAEDGKAIKSLLVRHGYNVMAVCTNGAQAMNFVDHLDYGIVVCGYRFGEMIYEDLKMNLPETVEMLLIASQAKISEGIVPGVVSVPMPIKSADLMNTLEMLMYSLNRRRKKDKLKPKKRSEEEKKLIQQAKELLMERNHMTEEEAHRYIQKNSMDSGTNLIETAQMVLQIYH